MKEKVLLNNITEHEKTSCGNILLQIIPDSILIL